MNSNNNSPNSLNQPMMSQSSKPSTNYQFSNLQNIPYANSASNNMSTQQNVARGFTSNNYFLDDDDKRKVKSIEQCILTCASGFSVPERMYNKVYNKMNRSKGISNADYRSMLIRRALLNVLEKEKKEGLGNVSASRTGYENAKQLYNVSSSMASKGYSKIANMFSSKKQGGRITKKAKKTRKNKKAKKQ